MDIGPTIAAAMDDELTADARALAHRAIQIARHYLDHGSPQNQLSVIRSLMPAVARAMADTGESEDLAEMRRELQALNQKLLSA